MNKQQLRKYIIKKLSSLSIKKRETIEQNICETLQGSRLWKQSKTIGITISRGVEWNTMAIIQKAWDEGKSVCVPKSYPDDHQMVFYKIKSFTQLKEQYHDLLEPIPTKTNEIEKHQIDLLIVPGLLFDESGFRIGFGGGYYDRFLKDFPNDTLSILHIMQLVNKIPIEIYDIPVNYLLVDKKIMKRRQ